MINRSLMLVFSISAIFIAIFGQMTLAQPLMSSDVVAPLVVVNGDTVSTYDLRLEIEIMKKMYPQSEGKIFSEPDRVLRRLIQNQLILQEGYRMGIEKEASVTNQVKELVRSKSMKALLDSVLLSVPEDSVNMAEASKNAVRSYIEGLKSAYNVTVDSTLLRSLDYASADKEVQEHLLKSTDVLATIPTGDVTVARFTKILRFREFHGLVGKPDAAERRDKALSEWISEAVVSYQARIQGIDQDPEIQTAARDLERVLIRQETLSILLKTSYEPREDEIEQFYKENLAEFMAPIRVKMKSKKLNTKEAAQAFREKLVEGASIEWLAENDPQVIPGKDPFPYDWFLPEKLGLKTEQIELGLIPEPYGVPGGWVVAVVSELEEPTPIPLAESRSLIISALKSRNQKTVMADIMVRLEEASEVKILPGAEHAVRGILADSN